MLLTLLRCGVPDLHLIVPNSADPTVKEAFENTPEIKLERFLETELSGIEPRSRIKLEALMHTSVELSGQLNGKPCAYRRSARPIITLVKDDTGR